jgi:hypothetical protein
MKIDGLNLLGQKYGTLTVIEYLGKKQYGKRTYNNWKCACQCGRTTESITSNLRNKHPNKSCGCKKEEKRLSKIKKPLYQASMLWLYRTYKSRIHSKKLQFELSVENFQKITSSDCFYCGERPSQKANNNRNNGSYIYNGIDRIDNNQGYTLENSRPCCGICNAAKNTMSEENFFKWIKKVYERLV